MFDIGWQELFILAVIAIIVIGPKDLPRAIRAVTGVLRKARGMARDLQDGLDDVVREAELDDLKNTISGEDGDVMGKIREAADLDFDAMDLDSDLRKEMTGAVDDLKSVTDPGESKKADKADEADEAEKTDKSDKTDKTDTVGS